MIVVGVDTGGTFTDVTAAEPGTGRLWITKVPSTPSDPSSAFLAGVERAMSLAGVGGNDVGLIAHGTTVATNAIIENKGARSALITTEGFRYVLDLGRHDIPRNENLYRWKKPERPITPDLIFEVRERIEHDGTVSVPLDEDSVQEAVEKIRRSDVRAVAVCTLHSYANPAHERRIAEILAEEMPGMLISLSCDVLPAFREYERMMLTAMNSSVMPLMSGYIRRIRDGMRQRGIGAPFVIMKSNGGVSGSETIAAQPVYTAMSGLAAGVLGACMVGRASGHRDLISLDIGGTSTDVAICPDAVPTLTAEIEINSFPMKAPSVDVKTIGAGGGSIAAILANGSIVVGPESAGADPGPVCYGRGGIQPTVTDAQVALGRLPNELAGGQLKLRPDLARMAIQRQLADRLSLSVEQAANGVIEILNFNIAGAIRAVSIERGYDPTQYVLMAFGGAGPLHGIRLAEILDMRTVLFPRYPGVLSALGLLGTPLRQDYVRTCFQMGPDYDAIALGSAFADIEETANRWFDTENMARDMRKIERLVDVRYPHQGYELQVPIDQGRLIDTELMRGVERAFHDLHKRLYGFAMEGSAIQVVNVRVAAIGMLPPLEMPPLSAGSAAAIPHVTRSVYIDDAIGFVECPAYRRDTLGVGATITGPAVVDQLDSTVFLRPGWYARVDAFGNLVAARSEHGDGR
ncbi:MAG: hydantoinase/oxoprolinase family protein [Alphaproteobacteria bacterium]|nr:hydantoinase/oxoprolinase family protein [Alphaproteobacteria bacterium]